MKIKTFVFLFSLAASAAWSQSTVAVPLVDGLTSDGEYATSQTKNDIAVGVKLSADKSTLYLSVSATASGWIAVGVGSLKMDGAFMVLGYVDAGKPFITYEQGSGHAHSTISPPKVSAAITESGGKTTLEVSMPISNYVVNNELQVISAIGSRDDAKSRHLKRAAYTFKL